MHLSSLDLSKNPLKLHTPSVKNLLQNLTRLEELDLSGVYISSFVPSFLANFSLLRSVSLQNCFLQSEFPVAILKQPNFEMLDVSSNSDLTGSLPEFHNSSLLEHVNVRATGFSGIIPESISNLNHLRILSLSRCSFSWRIPSSLSNLTQLTYLGLGNNNFSGYVPSLVSLSKLNTLELSGSKFEKGRVPNWLGKLSKLDRLYLYNMNISGEFPSFSNLTQLRLLAIGYNSLIGHIPSLFFNLTELIRLDLESNQLQGPISNQFFNFKSLQGLRLAFNNFSGKISLDVFIGVLNKIEVLSLGYNKLSVVATNNYTNNAFPQLKELELSSCNLKEFPPFLRIQNETEGLILPHNKIEGLVPVWIWNNSQETLHLIELSHNSITGFQQHPTFFPWRHLQAFSLRDNQLQGRLPIPPKTVVTYDTSYNNLTGDISRLMCEVKSLRVLDLFSNSMSGTLPSCLGSLSNSLVELKLGRNNFHGTMMNAFMQGSLLVSIDLSENAFTGRMPRSLLNCTNLEILSLGDNSFHDVFPSWLESLPKLQVLVLRSNKFYGPIQGLKAAWSGFHKLRIIDLSYNGFSGQLHQKYFQTWAAMQSIGELFVMESKMAFKSFHTVWPYTMTIVNKGVRTEYNKILTIFTAIDLSCNDLEGGIPSLVDLQGLQSLNLSNNHFSGGVLPSLGNLKNLESLDLSQNELSGEIPHQLMELNFLSIFNVSSNQLNGLIPQGGQFNTFENDSYMGNPGLCGKPLSKECQDSKASRLPLASNTSKFESLLPSDRTDWIIILCGVGSGLVVGLVSGNFLYTKYSDRFIKRKDRWVRPLRNTRRNQGVSQLQVGRARRSC